MGSGSSLVADLEANRRRHTRTSHLVKHILCCDWHAVLSRIESHPREVKTEWNMNLYGIYRTHVTPLHLICALRPPSMVVKAILNVDSGHSAATFLTNDKKQRKSSQISPSAMEGDEKVSKSRWNSDSAMQIRSKRLLKRPNGRSEPALSIKHSTRRGVSARTSSRHFTSVSQRIAIGESSRQASARSSSRSLSALSQRMGIISRLKPSRSARHETYQVHDEDDIFGDYSSGPLEQTSLLGHSIGVTGSDFYVSLESAQDLLVNQSRIEEDEEEENPHFHVRDQRDSPLNQSVNVSPDAPDSHQTASGTHEITQSSSSNSSRIDRRAQMVRLISNRSFQGGSNTVVDPDSSHWLPLHVACLFRASPDVILALIRACPWAKKVMNGMGMLPIHIVCADITEPPPPVFSDAAITNLEWNVVSCIRFLLRAFPDSMFMTSSNLDDMTPNEYAIEKFPRGADKEIVLNILRRSVDSFQPIESSATVSKVHSIRYDEGEVAIRSKEPNEGKPTKLWCHISKREWRQTLIRISRSPDEASVWTMIDDEATSGTACYRLALHKACTSVPPLHVVQALVNAYPKSIRIREKFAMFPLHVACAFRADRSVVQFLITEYPCALKAVDAWGRLPLHVAAVAGTTYSVLYLLMESHPQAVLQTDKRGRLPIDCVRNSNAPEKNLLISTLMTQAIQLDEPPMIPVSSNQPGSTDTTSGSKRSAARALASPLSQ